MREFERLEQALKKVKQEVIKALSPILLPIVKGLTKLLKRG